MSQALATAASERTVFFDSGGNQLFGIVSEPEAPNGRGVVVIQGGDTVNVSMMRNRLSVRVARMFAAAGFHVLRFDYHGLGESSGVLGELRLSAPFAPDAIAAVECLRRETGAGSVIMIGACFSARTALSAAPRIDDIGGLVLATPPSASFERTEGYAERMARDRGVGDYAAKALRLSTLKRLRDPEIRAVYFKLFRKKISQIFLRAKSTTTRDPFYWVSPHLLKPLDEMVDRQVPTYVCFGVEDSELREWERAEAGRLGEIVDRSNGLITVERGMPDRIHGFPTIAGQDAFVDATYDWVMGLPS